MTLAALALLELPRVVLGVAVRAEEEPFAHLALERELAVTPGPKLGLVGRRFASALRADNAGRHHLAS